MKLSKAIKIAIDAAMFILFVFLMGQHLTVDAHEWLGLAVFILFVLHNVLNYRWYAVLLQGRYTLLRSIQTTVNFLLLIVMIICLVSSVIVSVDVFSFMDMGGALVGRILHMITTAWAFVLMSIHLGLHWSVFVGMAKKMKCPNMLRQIIKWIMRIAAIAISVFGIYVFIERAFYQELFYLTAFKAFDYDKSIIVYLLESIALSSVFIYAAYYIKRFILYVGKINRRIK